MPNLLGQYYNTKFDAFKITKLRKERPVDTWNVVNSFYSTLKRF